MKRLFKVVDAQGTMIGSYFFDKKKDAKHLRDKISQEHSSKCHIALGPDHRLAKENQK